MTARSQWPRWAAAGVLAVLALGARGQDCKIPAPGAVLPDYVKTLELISFSTCLGDAKADAAPLVKRFNAVVEQPVVMGQTERLLAAVDLLRDEVSQANAAGVEAELWLAMAGELSTVRGELAGLRDVASSSVWLSAMASALRHKWAAAGSSGNIVLAGKPVKLLGGLPCVNDKPCADFHSRVRAVRVVNLMARLENFAQTPSLEQQFAASELTLAQWEAYRAKAHHQYIWEVAINGLMMDKTQCPVDAGTGMKMGFCKVPSSQWIVLHPEAALRFARTATKASELKPAILIEVIGRYGWDWSRVDGRETAGMSNRWGYSLAATYSQTETEKRWAFGPMFHYGDYSLALTKAASGGKWSVVLNMSLGERYFGRKQMVVEELAKVNKSSVLDLLFK